MNKFRVHAKNLSINWLLLCAGVVLFTLPQPNLFSVQGFPFLVYFALIPVFLLVRRVSFKTVWLYGIAYGSLCYCIYTYWLATFHPMGMIVIASLYALYLMIAFPFFKAADFLFPKWGWLVQWLFWCAYEYVKTLGFTGFHYGVTGYSQWQNTLLMQCADIAGIWGLSALVCFPSAWLTGLISAFLQKKQGWFKKNAVFAVFWIILFGLAHVYGVFAQVDYSKDKTFSVALIQPNSDPWLGGIAEYRKNLQVLKNLSNQAIEQNPNIDLVVWSETAFIPRIGWHYKYRLEREKYELVTELLTYIDSQHVPFLIGNDDGVMDFSYRGEYKELDYNAVLLFKPKQNVFPPAPEKYRKMHLVPFTEHFPYEKQFPHIYQMLINTDTHFWEPGNEAYVFNLNGLRFATPICFEDTFGYVARRFVNNGAQAIINLSNDAWSKSLACQYQHLSMAVFRSVENRIPSARSTASGQTVIIDPNGKITQMAPAFKESYIIGTIPIRSPQKTMYTVYGDFLGVIFFVLSLVVLFLGIILKVWSMKSYEKWKKDIIDRR